MQKNTLYLNSVENTGFNNVTTSSQNAIFKGFGEKFRSFIEKNIAHRGEDWFYERLAKPSRQKVDITPELAGKAKGITIRTKDGIDLQCFDINSGKSEKYVIFFHGAYFNVMNEDYQGLYKNLSDKGINILAVEYRGFGPNKGKVDEEGLARDADATYEYLIKKGIKPQDIGLVGHSIGAAVACRLASQKEVGFLVLNSTFSNALDSGRAILKSTSLKNRSDFKQRFGLWALTSGFTQLKNKFENDVHIKNVSAPILFVHCEHDSFAPIELAKKLYEQVRGQSDFVTIENCDIHEITPMEIDAISRYIQKQFTNPGTTVPCFSNSG